MEEQEPPIEDVHEEIHRHAEHARVGWVTGVALSTALMAALAAVTALFSGHDANEAMLEQLHASDQWAYYQAKGIKETVRSAKIDLLEAVGKTPAAEDRKKVEDDEREKKEIREKAEEAEAASRAHMKRHGVLSRGVTMFQMAIAVSAIAVLTKRRSFWFVGLVFGAVGMVFAIHALVMGV